MHGCIAKFLCQSHYKCAVPENIHAHPKDGLWKFQGGGGVLTAKIFKRTEIRRGWEGSNQRTILGGGMDIFGNHTIQKAE